MSADLAGNESDAGQPIVADALRKAPRITVLQLLSSLELDGSARRAMEIAEGVLKAGGRALIASSGGRLAARMRHAGVELIDLPLDVETQWRVWRNAAALGKIIAAEAVDVVHAHTAGTARSGHTASKNAGIGFVTTYAGPISKLPSLHERAMLRGRPVVAASSFVASRLVERAGLSPDQVAAIPGGVDLGVYNESMVPPERVVRLAQSWGVEDDARPVIMLPGELNRDAGHELFIDAMAQLRARRGPDFLGVMAGADSRGKEDYLLDLERRIAERGVQDCVFLAGHCADMPAAYLIAGCVVSAARDPETFGRVAIEAQAMGRPVVAPDYGGAREIVAQGETGWLARENDPASLADAMEEFLDMDRSSRAHMGASAVGRVRARFSVAQMQSAMLEIYERASGKTFAQWS